MAGHEGVGVGGGQPECVGFVTRPGMKCERSRVPNGARQPDTTGHDGDRFECGTPRLVPRLGGGAHDGVAAVRARVEHDDRAQDDIGMWAGKLERRVERLEASR